MDQRTKIRDLWVTVGDLSKDAPGCREIAYHFFLTDEQGEVIKRRESGLVYDGILGDPDQLPWLIAHSLRRFFTEEGGGK